MIAWFLVGGSSFDPFTPITAGDSHPLRLHNHIIHAAQPYPFTNCKQSTYDEPLIIGFYTCGIPTWRWGAGCSVLICVRHSIRCNRFRCKGKSFSDVFGMAWWVPSGSAKVASARGFYAMVWLKMSLWWLWLAIEHLGTLHHPLQGGTQNGGHQDHVVRVGGGGSLSPPT